MISLSTRIPLIAHVQGQHGRTAIVDSHGAFAYDDLLDASARVATALLTGRDDLREERVAFLIVPGFAWVAVQWGIWRAGGVAVPLPLGSARPELEYLIDDAHASALVFDAQAASLLTPIGTARGIRTLSYEQIFAHP
ncbi:MAG: AMP-binding protein, partial [Candidatus Sulfotelmatobacter sp.]